MPEVLGLHRGAVALDGDPVDLPGVVIRLTSGSKRGVRGTVIEAWVGRRER